MTQPISTSDYTAARTQEAGVIKAFNAQLGELNIAPITSEGGDVTGSDLSANVIPALNAKVAGSTDQEIKDDCTYLINAASFLERADLELDRNASPGATIDLGSVTRDLTDAQSYLDGVPVPQD